MIRRPLTMTDIALIQGCLKNDRRSQNALYERYFPLMSSVSRRYAQTEDEALQWTNYGFLKVLNGLSGFDTDKKLASWIKTILIHHCIDEYRKKQRHISSIHIQYEEGKGQGEVDWNLAENKWEVRELREMMSQLPSMTRTVFNLFAVDGYSHKEIAAHFGISTGTSKWHVNEARHRLQSMLKERRSMEKKMMEASYER